MTVWWLITWGTYGSWLPGDPRGFRTWRRREYVPPPYGRAESGEATYDPSAYAQRNEVARNRLTSNPVSLKLAERRQACSALVAEIATLRIVPAILAVATHHAHFISQFGELEIRPTIGRIKAAATRSFNEASFGLSSVWAKGCHMESLKSEDDFLTAYRYVEQHRMEGAVIQKWSSNIEWTFDD
jgi:hypothetical protein